MLISPIRSCVIETDRPDFAANSPCKVDSKVGSSAAVTPFSQNSYGWTRNKNQCSNNNEGLTLPLKSS